MHLEHDLFEQMDNPQLTHNKNNAMQTESNTTGPLTTEREIVINKQLRRDIDDKIQLVKSLPPSRERSLCITKLQEGVMWLGMDLKRINEANPGAIENPYPNSKDPSNTKIEPTADGLKL